jgi:hypothetical protein
MRHAELLKGREELKRLRQWLTGATDWEARINWKKLGFDWDEQFATILAIPEEPKVETKKAKSGCCSGQPDEPDPPVKPDGDCLTLSQLKKGLTVSGFCGVSKGILNEGMCERIVLEAERLRGYTVDPEEIPEDCERWVPRKAFAAVCSNLLERHEMIVLLGECAAKYKKPSEIDNLEMTPLSELRQLAIDNGAQLTSLSERVAGREFVTNGSTSTEELACCRRACGVRALGLFINTIIGPILDMSSTAFAPSSLIAPVTGTDIIWNVVLAPCTLGEKLTPLRVVGCLFIAGGDPPHAVTTTST